MTRYTVEIEDGVERWKDELGRLHRDGGPAYLENGSEAWYQHGKLHREDGPALTSREGTKRWYRDGLLHREDGPAVESSTGSKKWFIKGRSHREDGPAIEFSDGTTYYFLEGKEYKPETWYQLMARKNKDKENKAKGISDSYWGIPIFHDGQKFYYTPNSWCWSSQYIKAYSKPLDNYAVIDGVRYKLVKDE